MDISKYLSGEYLFIDTETTGLSKDDEIVELGIIDNHGNELYNGLFKPLCNMSPIASRISGITNESLMNCPSFESEFSKIASIISDKKLIAYNSPFDKRLFLQTADKHNVPINTANTLWEKSVDAMKVYKDYLNCPVKFYPKMERATKAEGIDVIQDHRAVGDCKMMLTLFEKMADPNHISSIDLLKNTLTDKEMANFVRAENNGNTPNNNLFSKQSSFVDRSQIPSSVTLYKYGKTIPEIAKIRGVKENTVINNLIDSYSNTGSHIDLSPFIQKEFRDDIIKLIHDESWDGRLRSIKEQLNPECTYECIKSVIAEDSLKTAMDKAIELVSKNKLFNNIWNSFTNDEKKNILSLSNFDFDKINWNEFSVEEKLEIFNNANIHPENNIDNKDESTLSSQAKDMLKAKENINHYDDSITNNPLKHEH